MSATSEHHWRYCSAFSTAFMSPFFALTMASSQPPSFVKPMSISCARQSDDVSVTDNVVSPVQRRGAYYSMLNKSVLTLLRRCRRHRWVERCLLLLAAVVLATAVLATRTPVHGP